MNLALGTNVTSGCTALRGWIGIAQQLRGPFTGLLSYFNMIRIDGSMAGADSDVIKSKLDHSDVRIVHMKNLDTGGWRIDIEYSSTREDLKGFVGKDFDIQAAMPSEAGGIYAILRPNVNEF